MRHECKQTVFIMTSNLGTPQLHEAILAQQAALDAGGRLCLSVCLSVSLSLSLALSLRCSCKRDRLPAGSPHREPRRRPRKRRARVPAICGALRLNGGQRLPRKSKPQSVNTVSIQKQLCTGLYMIMTNYTMVYSLMIRNNYTNKGHNGSNLHTDSTLYTSF